MKLDNWLKKIGILLIFFSLTFLTHAQNLCKTNEELNYCQLLDSLDSYTNTIINKNIKDDEKSKLSRSKRFIKDLKENIPNINSENKKKYLLDVCDSILDYNMIAKKGYTKTKLELKKLIPNIRMEIYDLSFKINETRNSDPCKPLENQIFRLKEQIKKIDENKTSEYWIYLSIVLSIVILGQFISYLVYFQPKYLKIIEEIKSKVKDNIKLLNEEQQGQINNYIIEKQNYIKALENKNNEILDKELKIQRLESAQKSPVNLNNTSIPIPIDQTTYYHFNIEPDGKSFKIVNATSEMTSRSLYKIIEKSNNIEMFLIENDINTKLLIDYSFDLLEPFFNTPSPSVIGIKLIKTKEPARLKRQGEYWVLDTKGTVIYI